MDVKMIGEDEIRRRMLEHLKARPGMTDVMILWDGFIIALMEARIIDADAMERLFKLIPPHDGMAVVEALCGEEYLAAHPTRESASEAA